MFDGHRFGGVLLIAQLVRDVSQSLRAAVPHPSTRQRRRHAAVLAACCGWGSIMYGMFGTTRIFVLYAAHVRFETCDASQCQPMCLPFPPPGNYCGEVVSDMMNQHKRNAAGFASFLCGYFGNEVTKQTSASVASACTDAETGGQKERMLDVIADRLKLRTAKKWGQCPQKLCSVVKQLCSEIVPREAHEYARKMTKPSAGVRKLGPPPRGTTGAAAMMFLIKFSDDDVNTIDNLHVPVLQLIASSKAWQVFDAKPLEGIEIAEYGRLASVMVLYNGYASDDPAKQLDKDDTMARPPRSRANRARASVSHTRAAKHPCRRPAVVATDPYTMASTVHSAVQQVAVQKLVDARDVARKACDWTKADRLKVRSIRPVPVVYTGCVIILIVSTVCAEVICFKAF